MEITNVDVIFYDLVIFGLYFTQRKIVTNKFQKVYNISGENNLFY